EFLKLQRNVGKDNKQVWSNDVTEEKAVNKATEVCNKVKINEEKEQVKKPKFLHTINIRGLPYKCTKSKIRNFFDPLKPISIRLPPKIKGIAYVSFESEQELKQSLVKHRGFLDGHRVEVTKYEDKSNANEATQKVYKENEPAEEDVCESGRIFLRNLCYSCTEEDIEQLFSKYGPLSEVSLPIDSFTKKLKGFGFVTFIFPEHAVKAFTELDGNIFQGRVLHLIPAKSKPEKKETSWSAGSSSFKNEKEQKRKEEANSSHNWNTLFLGANAVADLMSEKYGVTKSKLIADKDSRESVAVRMALGETQLVMETKKFLLSNGIDVDAFKETPTAR
ncbi:putative RNA-binding protein 19-like protein, partial [Leptotrombidium deliense]